MKSSFIAKYGLLGGAVVIYSFSSVCSKLASGHPFLSWEFILFYGLSLLVLVAYAVLWQQVLKRFDLSVAYAAKPIVTIMTMVWGVLLFRETITWNMVLGAIVILLGLSLVVTEHET